ncbi:MAG: hypothetical protein ACI8YQ_000916 [Polaribacter sp.]|jgi:hypothetical protein
MVLVLFLSKGVLTPLYWGKGNELSLTPSLQDAKVEKAVAFPMRKCLFNALLTR